MLEPSRTVEAGSVFPDVISWGKSLSESVCQWVRERVICRDDTHLKHHQFARFKLNFWRNTNLITRSANQGFVWCQGLREPSWSNPERSSAGKTRPSDSDGQNRSAVMQPPAAAEPHPFPRREAGYRPSPSGTACPPSPWGGTELLCRTGPRPRPAWGRSEEDGRSPWEGNFLGIPKKNNGYLSWLGIDYSRIEKKDNESKISCLTRTYKVLRYTTDISLKLCIKYPLFNS